MEYFMKQSALWEGRILCWFSCGAASAVASKLGCEEHGDRAEVIYCDTSASEHPDNMRFKSDVEVWIGREIRTLHSTTYASVDDVFEKRKFMSGSRGAICTTEMKKVPRNHYQDAADVHIFGYTVDEPKRIEDFELYNPELLTQYILAERGITKQDCYRILREAGIALPVMYALGFEHNNCIGCVKSQSPGYWNRTRRLFPEVFQRRAELSRKIGCQLVKLHGQRIFLDELPENEGLKEADGEIECGPFCQQPSHEEVFDERHFENI